VEEMVSTAGPSRANHMARLPLVLTFILPFVVLLIIVSWRELSSRLTIGGSEPGTQFLSLAKSAILGATAIRSSTETSDPRRSNDTEQQPVEMPTPPESEVFRVEPSLVVPDSFGRVTRITPFSDSHLIENTCVRFDPRNSESYVQVFTDHESDLEEFTANNAASRNLRMNTRWERMPANAWQSTVAEAGGVFRGKDVLEFSSEQQPAHCLHDYLFGAFLEVPSGRKFDAYIARKHPDRSCDIQKSWCCFLFHRAGIIKAENSAPFNRTMGCFERLWVIRFGVARYAPDWSHVDQSNHIPVYSHDESKRQFPLEHLKNLHKAVLTSDDKIINMRKVLPRQRRTNILVVDRTDARRRIWTNANEFVSVLMRRWDELSAERLGSLYLLGTRFGELTPLDQARLFHHADVVISPHGAQLSNVVFGEMKRTIVVIIGSEHDAHAQMGLYEIPENKSYLTWFSTFPQRLGMRVFTYIEQGPSSQQRVTDLNISGEALFDQLKRAKIFEEILPALD